MNKVKKPAWVLYDVLNVEVHISTRMTIEDKAKLRKALDSKTLKKGITNMVLVTGPVPPTDKPQIRVNITY
jgi:hypothetical protein